MQNFMLTKSFFIVLFSFIFYNNFYGQTCPTMITDQSMGSGDPYSFAVADCNNWPTSVTATTDGGGTYQVNACFPFGALEFVSLVSTGTADPVSSDGMITFMFSNISGPCVYTTSPGSHTANAASPEIELSAFGIDIPNNSNIAAATATNGTDFGDICASTGTASVTYTIANTGTGDLMLTGSPMAVTMTGDIDQFSVTQPASTTIGGGLSTTFIVTYNPTTAGQKSATVSIGNDDDDENPFTFVIKGTGIDPVVTVTAVTPTTDENLGTIVFRFTRSVCTSGNLTVNYSLAGSTINSDFSLNDSDSNITYIPGSNSGTVTFTGTNTTIDLIATPTNDNIVEANETIVIVISP